MVIVMVLNNGAKRIAVGFNAANAKGMSSKHPTNIAAKCWVGGSWGRL